MKNVFFPNECKWCFVKGHDHPEILCAAKGGAASSALWALWEREGGVFGAAALCCSSVHPESMEQIGGLGSASPTGERLPWQTCISRLSLFFSSVCHLSKQEDISTKTCLKLPKTHPAPLVNSKYKKPVFFYSKYNFTSFPSNSVKVTKLQP